MPARLEPTLAAADLPISLAMQMLAMHPEPDPRAGMPLPADWVDGWDRDRNWLGQGTLVAWLQRDPGHNADGSRVLPDVPRPLSPARQPAGETLQTQEGASMAQSMACLPFLSTRVTAQPACRG